jgi:hypothetical protein
MFHAVNLQANKATVNLYSRYLDLRPIGLLFIITLVMQNLNYCSAITSVESLRNAIAICHRNVFTLPYYSETSFFGRAFINNQQ